MREYLLLTSDKDLDKPQDEDIALSWIYEKFEEQGLETEFMQELTEIKDLIQNFEDVIPPIEHGDSSHFDDIKKRTGFKTKCDSFMLLAFEEAGIEILDHHSINFRDLEEDIKNDVGPDQFVPEDEQEKKLEDYKTLLGEYPTIAYFYEEKIANLVESNLKENGWEHIRYDKTTIIIEAYVNGYEYMFEVNDPKIFDAWTNCSSAYVNVWNEKYYIGVTEHEEAYDYISTEQIIASMYEYGLIEINNIRRFEPSWLEEKLNDFFKNIKIEQTREVIF